ncbi:unnamed protein product [Vicia faba]|uniref:Uncharacterized protein n=1 Tax=Vicia faba TaxID=3906 RepID=A0AAV1A9F1_VICFA|nr:unnamed protein product [Vicia faba]
MWWKSEHGSLKNDLKPLVNDEDATMLTMCAEETKCDVEIYTKKRLSSGEKTYMERLKEKEKGYVNVEENEDGEDSESSEDSLNDIYFKDSEEEMMYDFDEDMGEGAGIGGVDNGDGTSQMDNGQGIHKELNTADMQREHVIEDDYITNELDSGADDDSDDGRPSVIRFNEHENLIKEFKFKVGMKISSLKQFKKPVLEHNVLNGREVRFAKNDGTRIKTLFHKHKYGGKFFNKNANADWVSRVIVDKLKNNSGFQSKAAS